MNQRTVVVVGPSPRFLSGISYYTLRLSNALADHRQVTSLLFRYMLPQRLFPGWKRVGTDLTSLKYSEKIRVRETLDWYNPLTWIQASHEFRDADVIILEWWTSSVAHMFLALLLMNIKKIPVIIEFHEVVDPLEFSFAPIRIYARLMGRLIRRMACRYIVHSEHDRHLISTHYRIPESRIGVIPHGLYDQYPIHDQKDSKRSLMVSDYFIFLFFGLIRPYKGVIHLIHAFEMLPEAIKNNSFLYIVGEVWEDHASIDAAQTSPVSDRIRLLNKYASDGEIPVYFSAADALVLPYTRASQSGVAHIGISYGLPIIASKVGGLAESLSGYGGTTFVQPEDERELAHAMEQVHSVGYQRYQVPSELNWDSIARKYEKEISFIQSKE
ncbi:MAG TPA: glycosyltransferase [Methanospirillum sp.]|uniref:glycosyltransferase n=1 Tax=Methanospirillum sp. TaxID=45200 RepID=UPI002B9A55F6|nr:glycosyltransferase [Methanospirillum sp.]HWQ63165.1 glycosyltransferase [Methanospirillum sp.]